MFLENVSRITISLFSHRWIHTVGNTFVPSCLLIAFLCLCPVFVQCCLAMTTEEVSIFSNGSVDWMDGRKCHGVDIFGPAFRIWIYPFQGNKHFASECAGSLGNPVLSVYSVSNVASERTGQNNGGNSIEMTDDEVDHFILCLGLVSVVFIASMPLWCRDR